MGLIDQDRRESPAGKAARGALRVNGTSYDNAAAKFWATLLDEMHADYPGCSSIELRAPAGEDLSAEQLYPRIDLLRGLDDLIDQDIARLRRDTLAEMMMLGPPAAVRVRLLSGPREVKVGELPADVIDADILPYMVVWLLQWSELPPGQWNRDFVTGEFRAACLESGRGYKVTVSIRCRPIHEGLFERTVALCPVVVARI